MTQTQSAAGAPVRAKTLPGAPVLVCREGVLVPYAGAAGGLEAGARTSAHVSELDGLLLPQCRQFDQLRPQPPLAIALSAAEVEAVAAGAECGLMAATIFGPPQDKADNEDFALTAVIRSPAGPYLFAAVADGVSTRTFWPQRAARLACFTALRQCIAHVAGGCGASEADVKRLRTELPAALVAMLEQDRKLLRNTVPPDWSEPTFKRNQKKAEHWYNTTLLVALAGPDGIVLLWAGDGGIAIEKRQGQGAAVTSRPLSSTADMEVVNVVSLSGNIQFAAGRVARTDSLSEVVVRLSSDGADRTRQKLGRDIDLATVAGAEQLAQRLQDMCCARQAEIDNYSAAILTWRPDLAIAADARRRHASLARMIVPGGA